MLYRLNNYIKLVPVLLLSAILSNQQAIFDPDTGQRIYLEFELEAYDPDAQDVAIKIYNIKGQEITTLVSGTLNAGNHSFEWNASDQPSGLYIVRMVSGEYIDTQKLMLLK